MNETGEKIRTLIVDDEPLARQTLRCLLERDPEIEIAAECGDGVAALEALEHLAPELLFLDVQMPEMGGFEVLEEFGVERLPTVVFVTAYDRYAVRAFEVQALDYLLKPFDDERFARTLLRAKAQVRQREVKSLSQRLIALLETYEHVPPGQAEPSADPQTAPGRLTRLMIKSAGRICFLNVDEIDWIEAADYYVQLHIGAKAHLLRETMNVLESRLDPDKFQRIHRSAIVNLDRIKELQPTASGDCRVILRDGAVLKLSRHRRAKIEAALTRQP
jgi:two-component system, LytTR family, response regulator